MSHKFTIRQQSNYVTEAKDCHWPSNWIKLVLKVLKWMTISACSDLSPVLFERPIRLLCMKPDPSLN